MRKIPAELTKRYEDEGWWTPETLGDLVADGLQADPDTGFRVHSAVRPFAGTFADVELQARRLAAGLRDARRRPGRRGRVPAAELDGGRRVVLGLGVPRRGGGADRALLRPQGGRPHPGHRPAEGLHHRRAVRADEVPAGPVRGRARSSAWSGERRSTTCSPTSRWRARSPTDPAEPGADRLHLGHDQRPQGRHPHPPDPRLRDPPARTRTTRPTAAGSSPPPRSATSSGCSTPS